MPTPTDTLRLVVLIANVAVLAYFAATSAVNLWASTAAFGRLRRARWRRAAFDPSEALSAAVVPPITVLAPMYNEEAVCVEAVRALLGVGYPNMEVLVVNDGSKDGTVARLVDAFDLVPTPRYPNADLPTAEVRTAYRSRQRPNLWLLDKANGGKADALNAGVAHARTPLVCLLDGDSLLGHDALLRAVRPFLDDDDVVAAGGTIGIVNGSTVRMGRVEDTRLPRSWIARFQVVEYLRAFASARVGWAAADALLIISGAFGLFRRAAIVDVGGFDRSTVGEDMELVVRLHRQMREERRPYRVAYVPEAISWTECPESLAVLGRQRDRWHRGLAEILWRHRAVCFNPRYGRIGMVAYPAFLFIELLGPVIETFGYIVFALGVGLGIINLPVALLLLALALALGVMQSMMAVALEQLAFRRYTRARDVAQLLVLTVLENVGYRQLTVWWRLRGLWKFFRKDASWGEMTRKGFNTVPSTFPPPVSIMSRTSVALLCLLIARLAGRAEAQGGETGASGRWSASAGHAVETFAEDRSAWMTTRAFVQRRFEEGALALEAGRVERYDRAAPYAQADVYRTLWAGAYGNVRALAAPWAVTSAQTDVLAEVYQALPGGWDVSAGARRIDFEADAVWLGTASVATYAGPWLLRARTTVAPFDGQTAVSTSGSARLLQETPHGVVSVLEVAGGQGQELVVESPGGSGTLRRSWFGHVGGEWAVCDPLALRVGVGYTDDGALSRWSAEGTVVVRW